MILPKIDLPSWFPLIAFFVSVIALFVATKNYRRKTGMFVRGIFSVTSDIDCEDEYVSEIILENLKDRAVTIFNIYLKIGHSYYLEVENFENSPLLLKAYETYKNRYGPIELYGINNNKIKIDNLLNNRSISKKIVLSTSDGKYVISNQILRWSPIGDFFQNHYTAVIHTSRMVYKEKHVGSNIKFVIELVLENGIEQIITIRPRDYQLKMFNNFQLTRDSLESVESLKLFLQEKIDEGKLICSSFNVHDVQEWKNRRMSFYTGKTIEAEYIGFFKYHILGRLATRLSDNRLKKENEKRKIKQGT